MDDKILDAVWSRATAVDGCDPVSVRKDCCGALIMRSAYGDRDSDYGWEVDHIFPEALGGDDNIRNLRPMHWENNVSKGDDYPTYGAVVKAVGNKNVRIHEIFTVNKKIVSELDKIYNTDYAG